MEIFKVTTKTYYLLENRLRDIETLADIRKDFSQVQAERLMIAYASLARRYARSEQEYLDLTKGFIKTLRFTKPDLEVLKLKDIVLYYERYVDEYGTSDYRRWTTLDLVRFLDISRQEQAKMSTLYLNAEKQRRLYRLSKLEKENSDDCE